MTCNQTVISKFFLTKIILKLPEFSVTVHNLNRAFNALLAELDLKTGADGRTRTLYSFRHYSKYSPLLNAEVHSGREC